jgi:soluble P-type ATPase
MKPIEIPGFGDLHLRRLLLDYNGTLARDGKLLPGVKERLERLAGELEIHVVTADTFGSVAREMEGSGVEVIILKSDNHIVEKHHVLERLGADHTAAVGNGNNDALMLKYSVLGIAVLGEEGCALPALTSAELCCRSITDALDLLLHPKRLVATLRR